MQTGPQELLCALCSNTKGMCDTIVESFSLSECIHQASCLSGLWSVDHGLVSALQARLLCEWSAFTHRASHAVQHQA